MIVLISPAKTLDFSSPTATGTYSEPRFSAQSQTLIKQLRQLSTVEISRLMKLSDKLSELNYNRYAKWQVNPGDEQARQAILAFKGDVYIGLEAATFTTADFNFAQRHLRILSGLYGLLRPLDRIQPYRLEMGTALTTAQGKNLYAFWGNTLTQQLNDDIAASRAKAVINLASNEYAKAVQLKQLIVPVINPVFKEKKNGQLKIISFFAKKARGMMSAYLIKNRLQTPADLLSFDADGYRYNAALSKRHQPVFVR